MLKQSYIYFISILLLFNFAMANDTLTLEEKKWLKDNPNIKLAVTLDHIPVLFKDEDNNVKGILADYFKHISSFLDQDIEFEYFDNSKLDQINASKIKGVYGLAMLFNHPKFNDHFEFTKPYLHTKFIIFSSRDKQKQIKSIDDLKGKKIAVLKNSNMFIKYLKDIENIEIFRVNSIDEQLQLLQYGVVDAISGYNNYHYIINQMFYNNIVPAFSLKKTMGVRIAINKKYKPLKSILDKAIDSLEKNNKQTILSKWLGDKIASQEPLILTDEEKEYLKKHKSLSVATLKSFPPFSFFEDDKVQGYSVEYMKLMGKKIGIDIDFISNKSWTTYLQMLKDGSLDLMPHIVKTDERATYLDFTNFSHVSYSIVFATKKKNKLDSMADLNGKTLAVVRNTFTHKYIEKNFPDIRLLVAPTSLKSIEAVDLDKAYAVVGGLPIVKHFIQKNWLIDTKIVKLNDLGIPLTAEFPMGVKKGNRILKSILEKANASLSLSETSKLKEKWIGSKKQKNKSNIFFNISEKKYLESKKELKLCIDPKWMPLEMNKEGKHIGLSSVYMDIFKKQLNTSIRMIPTKSWSESLSYGKERKCDIFSLVIPTKERDKYLDFTNSYVTLPLVIATKSDKPFINDLSNIKGKNIGVIVDYAYTKELMDKYPQINFIKIPNIKTALKMVKNNELYGLIETLPTISYNIQEDYIGEISISSKLKQSISLSIGVRNDEPLLKNIFNKAIENITEEQHKEILEKWTTIKYQKRMNFDLIWQIALIFGVIILLILYKNILTKKINTKLKEENRYLKDNQKMMDKHAMFLFTDLNGVIKDVSQKYCEVVGFSRRELIGKTHAIMRHPDMSNEFFKNMWEEISEDKPFFAEIKNYTKDKDVVYFNIYIESDIKNDKKIGYKSYIEDLTQRRKSEKIAITDKLTNLYNRIKLNDILLSNIKQYEKEKNPFCVILLDIDNFEELNETFSYELGDEVLYNISQILKEYILKTNNHIGVWGEKKFLIICEDTNLEKSQQLAQDLKELIKNTPFQKTMGHTISLGLTQFNSQDTTNTLIKRVNNALYKAKETSNHIIVL